MFAKIYNLKFSGVSEAKVASSFCSDNLGKRISKYNIRSLNISIGSCGSLSISIRFQTGADLNKFDNDATSIFKDLKASFTFKENQYSGVFVYNYESEPISAEITVNSEM